jgi:hypothetical protein
VSRSTGMCESDHCTSLYIGAGQVRLDAALEGKS